MSKNQKIDWEFYLKNIDKKSFVFSGSSSYIIEFNDSGGKADKCFFEFENTGNILPCCENVLLSKVIEFKKSLNLNIKMWVSGYYSMMESIEYYLNELIDPPDWVCKSFMNQLSAKGKYSYYMDTFYPCNIKIDPSNFYNILEL